MDSLNEPACKSSVPLLKLNIAILLWAMTALFAKLIPLPADVLIWLRSVVGIAGFLPVLILINDLPRLNKTEIPFQIIIGLLMTIHWVTFYLAIQTSEVGLTLMALYAYPLFTVLMEPAFAKEKLHPTDLVLGLLVLLGLYILVPAFDWQNHYFQGVVWGTLSAFCFALRNLLSRYKARNVRSHHQMFFQVLIASLVLLPFSLPRLETSHLNNQDWIELLALSWLFVLVPHTLYVSSMKTLKSKTVALIATFQPIIGIFFAWLILDETPSANTWWGGTIILSVAVIETIRSQQQKQ